MSDDRVIHFNLTDGMTLSFENIKSFLTTPHDYKIFHKDGSIRLVNRTHVVTVEIRGGIEMPDDSTIQ